MPFIPRLLRRPALAFTLIMLALAPFARAADSQLAPLASRSLLLDVARAGSRLVVVGDRGHVLLSDDEGRTWRQVVVPARAMLTGVSFGDAKHGWAVGHDGVILATSDAGETWVRQDSTQDFETIYLDVFFRDASHGLAVGAYGKCVLTDDGGKTWQAAAAIPDEVHVNQITPTTTATLYLAGEGGTILSSGDAHQPWRRYGVPYEGSLFGVLPLGERSLLAYGLRGHVFATDDAGETWTERAISVPILIMAGVKLKSGVVVLAGIGGNFFVSRDDGRTFTGWKPADYNGGVASLIEANDGELVVIGELGAKRLTVPGGAP